MATAIDAQIIQVLGRTRGRWFCTEFLARAVGLPVADQEYRVANYVRTELRRFTDYETSECAMCDQCGKQGHLGPHGQRLIVRATT